MTIRKKYHSALSFPILNLSLNEASGIGVGMAMNMAPHNLKEIIDATVALIDKFLV